MRGTFILAGALCCAAVMAAWSEELDIGPRQLLASLQRVQDSIATGDRSALPLQTQMIAMLDQSFAKKAAGGTTEPPDPVSVLLFALSGGDRHTASAMISHMEADSPEHQLAAAVDAYVNGDAAKARTGFELIDPLKLDIRLAPYVALAKGTSSLGENDGAARRQFDIARLLSPGTLVEEVALRRLMTLHVKAGDAVSFANISQQYARRYIGSPYGQQFAEIFVNGCIALDPKLTAADIPGMLEGVPQDYRTALYLRLAKQAVISGRFKLSAFAANEIMKEKESMKGGRLTAQVRLYASIALLTADSGGEALDRLGGIDAGALPREDADLLRAAKSLAGAIMKPLDRAAAARKAPEPPAAAAADGQADMSSSGQVKDSAAGKADEFIGSAQKKFDAIDQLLSEASP
jgi:chemotaxis protein MotC